MVKVAYIPVDDGVGCIVYGVKVRILFLEYDPKDDRCTKEGAHCGDRQGVSSEVAENVADKQDVCSDKRGSGYC